MYGLRLTLVAFVLASFALIQGTTAMAASGYSLFGDATLVHPGHNSDTAVQLRSVGTTFGGIDFDTPTGMTVSQLNNLSTDYKFTVGSCGGGAPRFQVNVDGRNVFVYIGPPPNYTGCPAGVWANTGNLLGGFVDTSQFAGGTFYDTWAHFVSLYGSHLITGIQLVTDGGWAVAGGVSHRSSASRPSCPIPSFAVADSGPSGASAPRPPFSSARPRRYPEPLSVWISSGAPHRPPRPPLTFLRSSAT